MSAGLKKTVISKILLGSSSGEGGKENAHQEGVDTNSVYSLDLYSPFASKRKERGMYVFGRPFLNVLRALDRKAGRTSKMSGS